VAQPGGSQMTTTYQYTVSNNIRLSDESRNKSDEFNQIADNLPNNSIFTQCGGDYKGGEVNGYTHKENLLTKERALTHLQDGGNVGIVLGKWIDGVTYVLFDVEETDILPADIESIIQGHAVLTFDSPHLGRNRLVQIQSQKTYDLLRSLSQGESVNWFRDGDKEDLEIMTSGHAMIPPSSIDHRTCSDNKPCSGEGEDRYILQSVNPTAETIDYDTVDRLGELLDLTSSEESEPERPTETDIDVPSPIPKINPKKEFADNVPSVSHTFDDRLEFMKFGDWEGQSEFIQLWNGNFESVSGSNKQGRGECKLANYIGFFFGRNEDMIRFIMSTLPFETHYQKYPRHRKNLLNFTKNVNWCYCEGVDFETKLSVVLGIWGEDTTTVNELSEQAEISKRQVRNALDILESEDLIRRNKVGRKRYILNDGVTQGYVMELEKICEKYEEKEDMNEQTNNSNVEKVKI